MESFSYSTASETQNSQTDPIPEADQESQLEFLNYLGLVNPTLLWTSIPLDDGTLGQYVVSNVWEAFDSSVTTGASAIGSYEHTVNRTTNLVTSITTAELR